MGLVRLVLLVELTDAGDTDGVAALTAPAALTSEAIRQPIRHGALARDFDAHKVPEGLRKGEPCSIPLGRNSSFSAESARGPSGPIRSE